MWVDPTTREVRMVSRGRFFASLFTFSALVLFGQVLASTFFEDSVPQSIFDDLLTTYTDSGIVYIGHSALLARSPEHVSLPEMLAETKPGDSVYGFPLLGANAQMQYRFLRRLLERGPKPKAVVVGLDLELLFPRWNPFLKTQQSILRHDWFSRPILRSFIRPAAVFRFLQHISRVEQKDSSEVTLDEAVEAARNMPSGKAVGDFAHLPPGTVPKDAKYVRDLARILKAHGVPAVLYLTPINIERGEWVFGGNQREIALEAALYAQSEAEEGGGVLLNWLFEGKEEEFEENEVVSVPMLSGLQRRIAAKIEAQLAEVMPQQDQHLTEAK